MLRLSLSTEEYLMLGDDIKIVFLGGSNHHLRIMIEAPKEVNIVRSTVLKKNNPELKKNSPSYYAEPNLPEKYRKKRGTKPSNTNPAIIIRGLQAAGPAACASGYYRD